MARNQCCSAAISGSEPHSVSGGTLTKIVAIAKNATATVATIHAALFFFKSDRLVPKY
jgi:hypothetical protein